MLKIYKYAIGGLLLLLLMAGLFAAGMWYAARLAQFGERKSEVSSTVLLERIQRVSKLISVEGHFSEIYAHQDYYGFDISWFRKKALIRVQAKVSVGYDLEHLTIDVDEASKAFIIGNVPEASILSIDHDLDYYDLSEGSFNSFSARDYTLLNQKAKQIIEKKALESELFAEAERQGIQIFELIEFIAEQAGWQVRYRTRDGRRPGAPDSTAQSLPG